MVLYLSGNLFNKAEIYKGKILGMINGYQHNKETNTKDKIEIYYIKYHEKLYELSRIVWYENKFEISEKKIQIAGQEINEFKLPTKLDNIIYSIPNDDAMIYYKEETDEVLNLWNLHIPTYYSIKNGNDEIQCNISFKSVDKDIFMNNLLSLDDIIESYTCKKKMTVKLDDYKEL